jgi:hypothetical protein
MTKKKNNNTLTELNKSSNPKIPHHINAKSFKEQNERHQLANPNQSWITPMGGKAFFAFSCFPSLSYNENTCRQSMENIVNGSLVNIERMKHVH